MMLHFDPIHGVRKLGVAAHRVRIQPGIHRDHDLVRELPQGSNDRRRTFPGGSAVSMQTESEGVTR